MDIIDITLVKLHFYLKSTRHTLNWKASTNQEQNPDRRKSSTDPKQFKKGLSGHYVNYTCLVNEEVPLLMAGYPANVTPSLHPRFNSRVETHIIVNCDMLIMLMPVVSLVVYAIWKCYRLSYGLLRNAICHFTVSVTL